MHGRIVGNIEFHPPAQTCAFRNDDVQEILSPARQRFWLVRCRRMEIDRSMADIDDEMPVRPRVVVAWIGLAGVLDDA